MSISTTTKEREALKSVYPGKGWAEKVSKWSDEQVIAVYKRLKSQGKL